MAAILTAMVAEAGITSAVCDTGCTGEPTPATSSMRAGSYDCDAGLHRAPLDLRKALCMPAASSEGACVPSSSPSSSPDRKRQRTEQADGDGTQVVPETVLDGSLDGSLQQAGQLVETSSEEYSELTNPLPESAD